MYTTLLLMHGFRISFERDTRIPNAGAFCVLREDHTLGTVVSSFLQSQPTTIFAAYKVPHPLEHSFELRLQTSPHTDPVSSMLVAVEAAIIEFTSLEEAFRQALGHFNSQHAKKSPVSMHATF